MKIDKNIFVIILNYNSTVDTIALYNQIKTFHIDVNIIIVDNDSIKEEKDHLLQYIKEDQIIFNLKNLGYGKGNNVGIKKALDLDAQYIWVLNPDIQIEADTLPILIKTITSKSNIAAVGPRICYRNDKKQIYSDGGIVIKEKGFYTSHINYNKSIDSGSLDKIIEVDYINGSTIFFKASVFTNIGFMLEDFFLYFEETEWCLRAKDYNYKLLINTKAKAYHKSSVKGKLYKYYMIRNRILLSKLRNEYYYITLKNIITSLFKHLKKEVKNRNLTKSTFYGFKGLLSGVFSSVNK